MMPSFGGSAQIGSNTSTSYIPGAPVIQKEEVITQPPTEQTPIIIPSPPPVIIPPPVIDVPPPVIDVPKPIMVGPPAFPRPAPAPHTSGSDAYMANLRAWLNAIVNWERITFSSWQGLVVKDGGAKTYGNESVYKQWITQLKTYIAMKQANQTPIDKTSSMPMLPTPPPSNKLPYHDSIIAQVPSEVFSADMTTMIPGNTGTAPGSGGLTTSGGTTPGNYGYWLNQYINVLKAWAKIYISKQTTPIPVPPPVEVKPRIIGRGDNFINVSVPVTQAGLQITNADIIAFAKAHWSTTYHRITTINVEGNPGVRVTKVIFIVEKPPLPISCTKTEVWDDNNQKCVPFQKPPVPKVVPGPPLPMFMQDPPNPGTDDAKTFIEDYKVYQEAFKQWADTYGESWIKIVVDMAMKGEPIVWETDTLANTDPFNTWTKSMNSWWKTNFRFWETHPGLLPHLPPFPPKTLPPIRHPGIQEYLGEMMIWTESIDYWMQVYTDLDLKARKSPELPPDAQDPQEDELQPPIAPEPDLEPEGTGSQRPGTGIEEPPTPPQPEFVSPTQPKGVNKGVVAGGVVAGLAGLLSLAFFLKKKKKKE